MDLRVPLWPDELRYDPGRAVMALAVPLWTCLFRYEPTRAVMALAGALWPCTFRYELATGVMIFRASPHGSEHGDPLSRPGPPLLSAAAGASSGGRAVW